jgi:FixJ family two-component response regulator
MGRICTCCSHPQRREIDQALVQGRDNRRIAARYGLSENAVRRHRAEHIPELLLKGHHYRH